ncbi:hypothetical protein FRC00_002584 [Tulasnella sp. 408]|nr:hypothetical protein FRC00_002584 [Tulasnella sp. 408]
MSPPPEKLGHTVALVSSPVDSLPNALIVPPILPLLPISGLHQIILKFIASNTALVLSYNPQVVLPATTPRFIAEGAQGREAHSTEEANFSAIRSPTVRSYDRNAPVALVPKKRV